MKVCYVVPQSLALVNGGIKTQASQTIRELEKHGVQPVYLQSWQSINEAEVDLVHIFQASAETLEIARKFHELSKPIVLSPVFFSRHKSSTIKRSRRLESLTERWFKGIRTDYSIKANVCDFASIVAPNTQAEASLIEEGFSIPGDKISVIPNGVEERFAQASPDKFLEIYGKKDFILFAGQAGSPRKGLITLLEAAKKMETSLFVIGDLYDDKYGYKCRNYFEKFEHFHHIPNLPHDSELLASAYAASKVFVLPSLYETPGIAAMEAALAGAEIVITENGGTKEYFGDFAEYMTPFSVTSLTDALNRSLSNNSSGRLKERILTKFSWDRVAEQTFELYKRLAS